MITRIVAAASKAAGWTQGGRRLREFNTDQRSRGATPADYVGARLERLVRPAIALVVVVAGGLVALSLAGLPAEVVATAGFRIGQPLWFLGV